MHLPLNHSKPEPNQSTETTSTKIIWTIPNKNQNQPQLIQTRNEPTGPSPDQHWPSPGTRGSWPLWYVYTRFSMRFSALFKRVCFIILWGKGSQNFIFKRVSCFIHLNGKRRLRSVFFNVQKSCLLIWRVLDMTLSVLRMSRQYSLKSRSNRQSAS